MHKLDLLDFPGARSREKYKEQDIHTVLPKILRRGKVAYLFNKYSRSLRISSVLFCHHNDQKAEATIGETINSWIEDNIGSTPEERANMLNDTNGIAPLFFVATKFNIDLERTKTDNSSNIDKLDAHWNRFDTVFPEIIKPNKWLDNWVNQADYSELQLSKTFIHYVISTGLERMVYLMAIVMVQSSQKRKVFIRMLIIRTILKI